MFGSNSINLKNGEMLFLQGTKPDGIYILENGNLEILSTSEQYNSLDESIILSKSRRVGVLKGKTIISGFSRRLMEPYKKSLRAIDDCKLSKISLISGFQDVVKSNPDQAISALQQLFASLNLSMTDINRITKLYQHVCILEDNIALMYKELSETNADEKLHQYSEEMFTLFSGNKGTLPPKLDVRFLVTDQSKFLGKRYDIPGGPIGQKLDKKTYEFIKKILNLSPNVLKSMNQSDPEIPSYMHEVLSGNYLLVLNSIDRTLNTINSKLNTVLGAKASWSTYLVDRGGINEWLNSGKLSPDFPKSFVSLIVKFNSMYEDLTGKRIMDLFPGVRKIQQFGGTRKNQQVEQSEDENTDKFDSAPAANIGGAFDKSLNQIFEFSLVDKEFQQKFVKLLNEFKKSKNPFNTETEGRKLRRNITKLYWELFKQVFIRSKNESNVPRPVKLMLLFGYLDETMLESSQVAELNDLARIKERVKKYPILHENEFLSMVYSDKIEPSITEMGLNYKAHLREMEKHKSKKKSDEGHIQDDHIKKLIYEIEQRLTSTAAVCSGSTSTAFPILNSYAMKGSLKSIYASKEKVESLVNEILSIDFSAFYRETVLKLENDAREIIQEEVYPYFILLPIYGTKTLLWQDLSGTNKRTRGRIVVPMFFMGDLKKSLAHTIACFRWELNRTIRGAMWADPIDGGVTGEYFDYVNTFKKHTKLSKEAKDKIAERFKSLRTNRDRFADDYLSWILYEKDGIMKLNAVVREMFYKHIPFRKDIRDKLEKMPAFSHAGNRYKNISNRTYLGYERRFKKYMDAEGNYPEEIKLFMEFLKL